MNHNIIRLLEELATTNAMQYNKMNKSSNKNK